MVLWGLSLVLYTAAFFWGDPIDIFSILGLVVVVSLLALQIRRDLSLDSLVADLVD